MTSQPMFADAQPGDEVRFWDSGHTRTMRITRVTKTQVLVGSRRFRKTDGYNVEKHIGGCIRPVSEVDQ